MHVRPCLTAFTGLTCAAVVGPYPLPVVAGAAIHNVVGVIGFCNLIIGVYHNLAEGKQR